MVSIVVVIACGLGNIHDHTDLNDHLVHTSRGTFRRTFLPNPGTWFLFIALIVPNAERGACVDGKGVLLRLSTGLGLRRGDSGLWL